MPSKNPALADQGIENLIYEIRGQKVIIDSDLAALYGVPTFRFNEAIKRNKNRFPPDFMFQLSQAEFEALKSQTAISEREGTGTAKKHRALTSQIAISKIGAADAAIVLTLSPNMVRSKPRTY